MNSYLEHLSDAFKKTSLCIGLDPSPEDFPEFILNQEYPIFTFNQAIIDATADLVCAYKPQFAHYAALAAEDELEMTIDYIKEYYPEIPVILDAKRGDIPDTAQKYAMEAFERYGADALTVNPYLGADSLTPYLDYEDVGIFALCYTSNPGAHDLQTQTIDGKPLYLAVADLCLSLQDPAVGLVMGAKHLTAIHAVREYAPNMLLLVPGVGAQGGSYAAVLEAAGSKNVIINASRSILYVDSGKNFAKAAREAAIAVQGK